MLDETKKFDENKKTNGTVAKAILKDLESAHANAKASVKSLKAKIASDCKTYFQLETVDCKFDAYNLASEIKA